MWTRFLAPLFKTPSTATPVPDAVRRDPRDRPVSPRVLPYAGDATILLAVADPDFREALRLTLRGRGYAVLEASCGREAVNLCQGHGGPIGLLVAEAALTLVDGRPLAGRVREMRPATAALCLCEPGGTAPDPTARVLRAPFGLREFLEAVALAVRVPS